VDTIIRMLIMIVSALIAYAMVGSERRSRALPAASSLGLYFAVFGGVLFGLLHIWDWLSPKLTDTVPTKNNLLVAGIITLAVVVVLALDLIGRIDIMSPMRDSMNRMSADRGGPRNT
jgi:hypothetical protein